MAQIKTLDKCDLCDKEMGFYYCYECRKSICESCRNFHDILLSVKRHTLVNLQHVDRSDLNINTSCTKHREELVHFCEVCCNLTCSVCATSSDHKGHVFIDIDTIINREKVKLEKHNDKILSSIQIMTELVEDITIEKLPKVKKVCEEYVTSIEDLSTELKNVIEFVAAKETEKVKHFYENEKQHLNFELANIEKIRTDHMNIQRRIEQNLDEKPKTYLINMSKTIVEDINALDCIPTVAKLEMMKPFSKEEFLTMVIDQVMTKYPIRIVEDKLKEINVLKDSLSTAQNEIVKLRNEIEKLRNEIEHLKRNFEKYKTRIAEDKEKEIKVLNDNLTRTINEIGELKEESARAVQVKEMEIKALQESLTTAQKEIKALQESLTTAQNKIKILREEMGVLKKKTESECLRIHIKENEIKDLRRKMSSEHNKIKELENAIEEKGKVEERYLSSMEYKKSKPKSKDTENYSIVVDVSSALN